jgi:hypothetical protein
MNTSPYLSLRQAARPAIFAHRLLAGDQDRAERLAAECEDLLFLSRELVKAAGRARLLGPEPGQPSGPGRQPEPAQLSDPGRRPEPGPPREPPEPIAPGDPRGLLLDAYAEAAMLWAKVAGSCLALGGTLIERGDLEDARQLAGFLHEAGEASAAADLRMQLGRVIWEGHREQLQSISTRMPPGEIKKTLTALRTILLEVPEDFPERDREVNRLLPPLASAIYAYMKEHNIVMSYNSRVGHIATGGVAKYPEIVKVSLDELSAEFDGACR